MKSLRNTKYKGQQAIVLNETIQEIVSINGIPFSKRRWKIETIGHPVIE